MHSTVLLVIAALAGTSVAAGSAAPPARALPKHSICRCGQLHAHSMHLSRDDAWQKRAVLLL
eukprot:COSAG02_NODE_7803_length_2839_cov_1.781022_3_plen_62_part_00